MPPARAARSGASPRRSTRATTRSIPIAAPTDEEQAHHYLWRFWRHLPRAGRVTIFDRSWYGRVLVERVEGLATPAEWRRAYAEINQFEDQLVGHGIVLVKYWIHITEGRAAAALQGPRALTIQELEDHRRGLAQPREVGRTTSTPSTTWSSGRARAGAVDARRRQRQVLRAHQDPADRVRAPAAGAVTRKPHRHENRPMPTALVGRPLDRVPRANRRHTIRHQY